MTKSKLLGFSVAIAFIALATVPLRASDPVGVYGIVDKVVFEPNETNAIAAQVWGTFSLAIPRLNTGEQTKPAGSFGNQQSGDVYGAVQKGFLYLTCAKSQETSCRNEWSDLKSVAGKTDIVGFATRWGIHITVRKAADKPAAPDEYSSNIGVVKMGRFSTDPALTAALEATSRAK